MGRPSSTLARFIAEVISSESCCSFDMASADGGRGSATGVMIWIRGGGPRHADQLAQTLIVRAAVAKNRTAMQRP